MFKHKYFFLLGLFIWCLPFLYAQNNENFRHLSPTYDNHVVNVRCVVQGPSGNIWMSFSKGVLVYNGYNYKLIKTQTIFPNIDKDERIKSLIADHYSNIWILTNLGKVARFNANTEKIENITSLLEKSVAISKILAKNNSIWLASTHGSIYSYSNAELKKITTIPNISSPFNTIVDIELINSNELFISTDAGEIINYSIDSKLISKLKCSVSNHLDKYSLVADDMNRLWIGSESKGLLIYDVSNKQFIQNNHLKNNNFIIDKSLFINMFYDSKGFIWAGTDGDGLFKINSKNGKIELFKNSNLNEFSLSSNTIMNVSEDNQNNIWVSTNYGKLNILPSSNKILKYHNGSEDNTPVRILSIYKSSLGTLWIGTDGSGLTKITINKDGTTNKKQYFKNSLSKKGFYIQTITEDHDANMWFGTYKSGLWLYNTKTENFKKIDIYNSKHQKATDIRTVYTDSKGRIWVGSNLSINLYSSKLKLLASFENNTNGLLGDIARSILEDKNGVIWLGVSRGGFFQFNENQIDIKKSKFTNIPNNNEFTDVKIHSVKSMTLVGSEKIGLITGIGKLLIFNIKDKSFHLIENMELRNISNFAAILSENEDNLWISSSNGIFHLNNKDSIIQTFFTIDGLQDNNFLSRSSFKDKQGVMYFGGVKGLNYFNPRFLNKKESNAKLYFDSIEILNKPADSLIPSQITTGISNIKSIKLNHNQSSFTFRFYAIDNILEPQFHYTHRLKGFNEKWSPIHTERVATYTNLSPGKYIFEVKAGTKKGEWNISKKSIEINIGPPIWNRPLAYFFYFALLIFIVYSTIRWYSIRKKLLSDKISYKKEIELHDLKMNFFAKMSHEIQTPITLVLAPIEEMIKRAENNGDLLLKQRLNIISYNTKRLSRIARELTLVRNEELGRLKLLVTKNNLYKNIQDISTSFKEIARNKKIDFAVSCPQNLSMVWYDKGKFEHIIYNLLSNAFKFTPKNGNIQLHVIPDNSKQKIKISISDSGSGIGKEELEKIFELFYQSSTGRKRIGSGIGLALTKEIIDLHKGKIDVKSSLDEGTVFEVTLPISVDAYNESERIITNNLEDLDSDESVIEQKTLNEYKKTILIVEDNYDLQMFLKKLLENQYNILLACDGEEGFQYAKNYFPNLILSDIMMPKMDGIQMCKKIQNDNLTQHIPIMLITAKNSTNSKIEGLKSGAMEYINKPFNTNELLLKIKNIIISKEHIISKYRKEILSQPKVKLQKSQDEIFLENLVTNINLKIEDSNLKIEDLAESLNISYSSLYRKCQLLTGKTIVDFIRVVRLKKAAVLIIKYGYNISEASYKAGFNDPKYFSKSFKKYFKKTPSNFKKEALKTNVQDYLARYQLENFN